MPSESLFDAFTRNYEARRETDMSVAEYLALCKKDPMAYANAAERLLAAIGEPQMVDTAKDARLGRIFMNRTIRAYPAFAGFYGMEETRSESRSSTCSDRSAAASRRSPSG
jgi:serine protein kinase